MLLSATEAERLIVRDALVPRSRAANDIRVKRKLAAWLKNLADAELILEHLPENQTRNMIEDDIIYSLLYTVDRLMEIKKFYPVAGPIESPDEWAAVIGEKITKPAEDLDIWRSKQLGERLERLNRFIGDDNPICRALNLEKLERMGLKDHLKENEKAEIRRLKQVYSSMVSYSRNEMIKASRKE